MKKVFIVLFAAVAGMVCSCSNTYLSNDQLSVEQVRVVEYYTNRSEGFPFRSGFYAASDSVYSSVSGGDAKTCQLIYTRIQKQRPLDSTGHISADYFKTLSAEFDNDFDIAKGGRE